ncbi:MAG: sugar ABC transporter ATP-binding protein [Acidimicrobiales bacterium]
MTVRFGGVLALDRVSLAIMPGMVHVIAGENGSGKSTLIKVMSGVVTPNHGYVQIAGKRHQGLDPRTAIAEGVNVVYQDLSLFPNLTVAENIALPLQNAERRRLWDGRAAAKVATPLLTLMGVSIDPMTRVASLPFAERQLVAIARSLAQEAKVVLLDEPTAALTPKEVSALFDVVARLREGGTAIVFVSHHLGEMLAVGDRVTVLRNGRIVADGPVGEFDRRGLSSAMIGHEVEDSRPAPLSAVGAEQPVLEVLHLTCPPMYFDVSFALGRGEVLGLAGLRGSGGEALLESLIGRRPPSGGRILVKGEPHAFRKVADALHAGIGFVPGDRLNEGLFLTEPVGDNVVAADITRVSSRWGVLSRRGVTTTASRMVRSLHIKTPSTAVPVKTLSGGNQQKVVLAKWLLREPEVLALNGPTIGVDVGAKAEIQALLTELSRQGKAIILLSDDIPEIISLCHRVIVFSAGRVSRVLVGSDVNEEEIMKAAAA